MSTADVLNSLNLPAFGQRAVGEIPKPAKGIRVKATRVPRSALRTYEPIPIESNDGYAKRLEFQRAERACLKAAGHICQARLSGVCTVRARTAHHKRLRAQGGDNDPSNLLAVCRACHKKLHNAPAMAAKLGHTKRRSVEPAVTGNEVAA